MANRVFQNVVYQMKDAVDRVVGVADDSAAEEPSVTPVADHTPVPSEPVAAEVPAETAGERATEPAPAGPAPKAGRPVVENAGAEPAAEVAGADTETGAAPGSETPALEASASGGPVADGPASETPAPAAPDAERPAAPRRRVRRRGILVLNRIPHLQRLPHQKGPGHPVRLQQLIFSLGLVFQRDGPEAVA